MLIVLVMIRVANSLVVVMVLVINESLVVRVVVIVVSVDEDLPRVMKVFQVLICHFIGSMMLMRDILIGLPNFMIEYDERMLTVQILM